MALLHKPAYRRCQPPFVPTATANDTKDMIALIALMSMSDAPSVEKIRLDALRRAWTTCIAIRASELEQMSPMADRVTVGTAQCIELEEDVRRALVLWAPESLRSDGITSFGPDVAVAVANETLNGMRDAVQADAIRALVAVEQEMRQQ